MPSNKLPCQINIDEILKIAQGDNEILQTLIQTFISQTKESLSDIEESLAKENFSDMRKHLHKLLPSTSYFSSELFASLQSLQELARKEDAAEAQVLLSSIVKCFREVHSKLASVLEKNKS